ncbi:HAD family hydrolase [Rhodoplanes roseus]|uniref:HAD family hydrolase n=1 Tax=Rhodoplanes roseus TaxID=29409 RepID=A0A327L0C5_9BRAD|nr:HAD family hydrolase [Rhodoplanes roseus]RAI44379.1 HAD family hydrolase [Rhodoplanes roseus]
MVRAIIFDIDGTLIDSVDAHAESWVRALAQFGVEADFHDVRRRIGMGADRLMPAFAPDDLLQRHGKDIESYRSDLFKREYLPTIRPFPRVRDLFERIRANGQTIVLGSSCAADEIEDYKRIAGVADLVDAQTTKDDASRSKPSPDIFRAALDQIAPIPTGDVVVVGDSVYDAQAARHAGVAVIGVLCGGSTEQALREAGCVAVYRDPADLLVGYEDSPLAAGGRVPVPTPELQRSADSSDIQQPDQGQDR